MVAEVVDVARGNPLALREIPLSLTPGQRVGIAPLGDALLNCRSAERAILARISALGEDARRALLVVALGYGEDDAAVARALQSARLSREELRPAEEAALVAISGGRFSFPHPLVRSTVVYGALRSERRAAHAALAGASNSNSSIWHAALAASGPDERIAALLEDAAGRALSRHAHSAAARALELAARLSPARAKRARRLVGAAEAAALAGHIYAAIDHVEAALPSSTMGGRGPRPNCCSAACSRAAARPRGHATCYSTVLRAARRLKAGGGPSARCCGDPGAPRRFARARLRNRTAGARGRRGGTDRSRCGAHARHGADVQRRSARRPRASPPSHRAPRASSRGAPAARLPRRWSSPRRRARPCSGRARKLIANARSHGAFGLLPYALVRLADVELDTGHWPAAHAALAEAASLARETGQGADQGLASGALAWLDAAQGRAVDCRRHAGEAIALAMRLGAGSRLDRAVPALGLLALGCGELDAAIEHLAEVRKTQLEQGWCDAAVLPHRARDLIEALVRAGRAADAERELSIFEQESRQTERPSALAALACCRGLLAES